MSGESAAQHKQINAVSAAVLHEALVQTNSEYGFIGPVVDGGPQGSTLRVLADEGFNWDPAVNRALYDKVRSDYAELGYIDFPYLDNLFGWPIKRAQSLIANEPNADYRRSGRRPAGHPPLDSFLGVPIFRGNTVVGSIGVANRPGGYTDEEKVLVEKLGEQLSPLYEFYRRGIKQIEAEQKQRQAELHNEMLAQRLLDLSYVVSHELQGPCRFLESELRLLSARYKERLGDDADQFIENSVKTARLISRMVEDLWMFARIDSSSNRAEQVDLDDLTTKIASSLRSELSARNARVEFGNLGRIMGVRRQIEYMFEQLISNAIAFNKSEQPIVKIRTQRLVEETILEFEDNGIGFDTMQFPQMLKMFAKDKESKGTGMGLAIVEAIVAFHGGKIWATANEGDGTTIFIRVPDNHFITAHGNTAAS